LGVRRQGSTVFVLETRANERGMARLRFEAKGLSGWCSEKAADGTVLLLSTI
jgi:hypothetical protein